MEIYTDSDLELFGQEFGKVIEKVKKQQLIHFDPSGEEIRDVFGVIIDFIKTNNRKVYGGYGLNLLLNQESDSIYSENDNPDIDFYSPEPLKDLMALCDELHKRGYKSVAGKEAAHKETYTVFVNYIAYCDISYCPTVVYNNLGFIRVSGFVVVHPHLMLIDLYLMTTDLLNSSWRIEKALPRIRKLLRYYPLPNHERNLPASLTSLDKQPGLGELVSEVLSFLIDNETIVVHGHYAYNYLISKAGSKHSQKNFKVPYYEFISDTYEKTVTSLVTLLKSINQGVKVVEKYPLFHFFGHSADIMLETKAGSCLVARIYDAGDRCVPYHDVPAIVFEPKPKRIPGTIRLGSFPHIALMALVTSLGYKVARLTEDYKHAQTLVSGLFRLRQEYFRENPEQNMFTQGSLFEEYVTTCRGAKVNIIVDRLRRIEKKKRAGTGPYVFRYTPGTNASKEAILGYRFANTSGNPIRNERNLRLAGNEEEKEEEKGEGGKKISKDKKEGKKISKDKKEGKKINGKRKNEAKSILGNL